MLTFLTYRKTVQRDKIGSLWTVFKFDADKAISNYFQFLIKNHHHHDYQTCRFDGGISY